MSKFVLYLVFALGFFSGAWCVLLVWFLVECGKFQHLCQHVIDTINGKEQP